MKPFLTEILACPIDKSFPLDVFIFKWENFPPEVLEFFQNPTLDTITKAFGNTLIHFAEDDDGQVQIGDLIVLGKKPFGEYLNLILEKIKELEVFHDTTNSLLISKLSDILNSVRENVSRASEALKKGTTPKTLLPTIELDLNLLNAYKQRVEIEEGILRCPKCKRWYPIVETIPQMLPDNLRHQKKDLEFLTKWQTPVPIDITREGQPWHL
ncbi:MAG: uncharacterized protein family UPF0434/Trm112 [Promethearchaeota archaeon CR_4]|nr:MAG: uncharacterized protein family UPF0434/Trm112 [Candidatus Lokiarchaeota archaeon CR_4]